MGGGPGRDIPKVSPLQVSPSGSVFCDFTLCSLCWIILEHMRIILYQFLGPHIRCPGIGCNKMFQSRGGLHKHKKKCQFPLPVQESKYHYRKEPGQYVCNICDRGFAAVSNYYRHHKTLHQEPKHQNPKNKYICKVCSKKCAKKSHLIKHEQKHFKPTLHCRFCHRSYTRGDHLKNHKDICLNDKRENEDETSRTERYDGSMNDEEDLEFIG